MSTKVTSPAQEQTERVPRSAAFKIARNAASILIGDAAGEMLVGYAIVLGAVSLGPSGFGILCEAQAFMDPFDALAALGLTQVAISVAARRGGCDGALRGTVRGIRTASATVAIAAAFIMAAATNRFHLMPLMAVTAMGMLVTPVTIASNLPFQYEQRIHRRIAIPFLAGLVRLATAYLALWYFSKPVGFALSGFIAAVAGALLLRYWAKRHFNEPLRFSFELARHLLRIGWPIAVLEFVVTVYMRAAYFLLHGAGPRVVGEYAAADRLIRPLLAIAGAVFSSSLPTVAQQAARHEFHEMLRVYRRALARVISGLIPIGIAAWFLASWLLGRFAHDYVDAIWPFRILMIGTFFMFLNQLSATYIMALGKFRVIMTVAMVNLGVYLVFGSRFIPRYGASGAAMATSAMEAINTVMQLVLVFVLLRRSAGLASRRESDP